MMKLIIRILYSFHSVTEQISAFVDFHLQPIVQSLPSHIKDSNHFLTILHSSPFLPILWLSPLMTLPCTPTSPHSHGLSAHEKFLFRHSPASCPSSHFLLSPTHFILTDNYFSFNSLYYLQEGTTTGTRMAPSYANLFMGSLEEDFLNSGL